MKYVINVLFIIINVFYSYNKFINFFFNYVNIIC